MSEMNLERDRRRWHLLLLLTSSALLLLLLAAGWRAKAAPWRLLQQRFFETYEKGGEVGILELAACGGETDRCTTCHLGAARGDLKKSAVALPFRGHGPSLGKHDLRQVGCSSCHGGVGRALDPESSHMAAESGARDPRMRQPHIQASCAGCHLPGERAGQERLLEGAELFAGLGCPICHPLTEQGLGGVDFGPDLREIGQRSPKYLETSLIDPAANFEGSTMPSFRLALGSAEEPRESLVIFLESLVLPRLTGCRDREASRQLVKAPCAECHAGEGGRASGRKSHQCPYILKRREELRCSGCHPTEVPATGPGKGYCPFIRQHRDACAVCHEERSP